MALLLLLFEVEGVCPGLRGVIEDVSVVAEEE